MSNASSSPVAAHANKPPLNGLSATVLSFLSTVFIYVAAPVAGAIVLVLYGSAQGWPSARIESWLTDSVVAQFFYILIAEVLTVLAIWGLLKLFRWSWRSIGLTKPRWYDPLLGIAAAVPYFIILVIVIQVVSALVPGFDSAQEQQIGFESVNGSFQLALTFIGLVVLAPIAEEITMRGFLYTGLRKWLPRVIAILAVSVLFGAAHLTQGGDAGPLWVGALDTAILSVVLLILREVTGNLWAGITLHMIKNFVAFLALFVFHIG